MLDSFHGMCMAINRTLIILMCLSFSTIYHSVDSSRMMGRTFCLTVVSTSIMGLEHVQLLAKVQSVDIHIDGMCMDGTQVFHTSLSFGTLLMYSSTMMGSVLLYCI